MEFTNLIENNRFKILRICRIYGISKEDREDLFQEVCMAIWKSLPTFQGRANINTWLYRVSLNTCMQHNLKQKKHKEISLHGLEFHFKTGKDEIVNNIEKEEMISTLYSCIAGLKEPDKTIALLYLEDVPYKSVAEITGLSENNIAVRMHRIKEKLFKLLKMEASSKK